MERRTLKTVLLATSATGAVVQLTELVSLTAPPALVVLPQPISGAPITIIRQTMFFV